MKVPPFNDAYWVVDDVLLAGAHPGPYDLATARERISRLLDAGVEVFIDLTDPIEVPSYEDILRDEAGARGADVDYMRSPVRDRGLPSNENLLAVLAAIDAAVGAGRRAYVHCWGGIGRTGTIVGCWLAQNGHSGAAALERLERLRAGCLGGNWRSPETDAQRELVRTWRAEKRDSHT